MKYLVTLEIDDPEGALGDSPDPADVAAWSRYLDIEPGAANTVRVVKVEVLP